MAAFESDHAVDIWMIISNIACKKWGRGGDLKGK